MSGTIYEGREEDMNPYKEAISRVTNRSMMKGTLADAARATGVAQINL